MFENSTADLLGLVPGREPAEEPNETLRIGMRLDVLSARWRRPGEHPGFTGGHKVGSRPPGPIVVGAHRVAVLRAWGGAPKLLRREATAWRECSAARVEAQHEKWLHLDLRTCASRTDRGDRVDSASGQAPCWRVYDE